MPWLAIGLHGDWTAYEQALGGLLGDAEPVHVAEARVWQRLADGSLVPEWAARTHGHVLLGLLMRHGMVSVPLVEGSYDVGEHWEAELRRAYEAYATGDDDPMLLRLASLWACAWSAEAWLVALSSAAAHPLGHPDHQRHRRWQGEAWACYEAARNALDPDTGLPSTGPSVASAVEVWRVCSAIAGVDASPTMVIVDAPGDHERPEGEAGAAAERDR